MKVVKKL